MIFIAGETVNIKSRNCAIVVHCYKWATFFVLLLSPPALWARAEVVAIEGVSIDTTQCLRVPPEELTFACHRFAKGIGFAVALRDYWPQERGDDDAFEKLTILFKEEPEAGQTIVLPSEDVFCFS